eukprot:scaffold286328_cov24-Tisochrysis_lutea.AAC.1
MRCHVEDRQALPYGRWACTALKPKSSEARRLCTTWKALHALACGRQASTATWKMGMDCRNGGW